MTGMKQEFGYFLKNAKFRAALGLTLLLSYGYAIATTRVSIDSLEGDRYIGTGGVMLSSGRFGMNLWAAVLGYGRAEPSYAFGIDLLAALLLALAACAAVLLGGALWFLIMKTTRYVSVASLAALLFVAGAFGFFGLHRAFVMLALGLAALSLWRHRDNLKRLAGGTENKVGQK